MKRFSWPLASGIALLAGLFLLSGCKNGNLFGALHHSGDSSNTTYLLSDAAVAVHNKDYSSALALYERVLDQDPNNSEALSGAATAAIGSSGLNFGTIVSNIVSQSSTLSASDLGDFIVKAREQVHANSSAPNSLLQGVDLEALNNVIDKAICRLARIVGGATDQKISKDDINVTVNLAALYVLRAVLKPLRHGYLDITNAGGSYAVVVNPSLTTSVCNDTTQQPLIQGVIVDAANAYALFHHAAVILNLASDKLLSKLSIDVQDAGNGLLTDSSMPPACVAQFNAVGIHSVTDIQNWNQPFTTVPSGC